MPNAGVYNCRIFAQMYDRPSPTSITKLNKFSNSMVERALFGIQILPVLALFDINLSTSWTFYCLFIGSGIDYYSYEGPLLLKCSVVTKTQCSKAGFCAPGFVYLDYPWLKSMQSNSQGLTQYLCVRGFLSVWGRGVLLNPFLPEDLLLRSCVWIYGTSVNESSEFESFNLQNIWGMVVGQVLIIIIIIIISIISIIISIIISYWLVMI